MCNHLPTAAAPHPSSSVSQFASPGKWAECRRGNLGGPTLCLVANSPESEREWWSQRSISTAVVVAGAGLFSGIVHPDREGGEGDQERDRGGPL